MRSILVISPNCSLIDILVKEAGTALISGNRHHRIRKATGESCSIHVLLKTDILTICADQTRKLSPRAIKKKRCQERRYHAEFIVKEYFLSREILNDKALFYRYCPMPWCAFFLNLKWIQTDQVYNIYERGGRALQAKYNKYKKKRIHYLQ